MNRRRHAARGWFLAAAALVGLFVPAAPAMAADGTPSPAPSSSSLGDGGPGESLTFGLQPVAESGQQTRGSFSVSARPGDVIEDGVSIFNYSNTPLSFRLYAADARNQPAGGGFSLLEYGEKSEGVGTWITAPNVGAKFITVAARTQVDVPIRIAVPKDATPGDHIGGVLLSVPSSEAASDAVTIEPRIGVPVRVRVAGALTPGLEITDLTAAYDGVLQPWAAGTATVSFTVRNTGNVTLAGRPSVALNGPSGWGAQNQDLPEMPPVLPGQSVRLQTTFSDVWPLVRYDVTASVEPLSREGDPVLGDVSAQTVLWAWPWPQVVALLILIALAILIRWLMRRRSGGAAAGAHSKPTPSRSEYVGSQS